MMLITASAKSPLFFFSCWRVRNSTGRRVIRAAAMVGGTGTTPIRLMPRLAQSSGSREPVLLR